MNKLTKHEKVASSKLKILGTSSKCILSIGNKYIIKRIHSEQIQNVSNTSR